MCYLRSQDTINYITRLLPTFKLNKNKPSTMSNLDVEQKIEKIGKRTDAVVLENE